MRTASVTPKFAASMFPPQKCEPALRQPSRPTSNMSKRRTETSPNTLKSAYERDEFDEDGIDHDELLNAAYSDFDFNHIDNYTLLEDTTTQKRTAKNDPMRRKERFEQQPEVVRNQKQDARQLANGKWACNHPCKDKVACKHLCCKEGMDKPPKKPAPKHTSSNELCDGPYDQSSARFENKDKKVQTKLQLSAPKRKISAVIDELDLTQQAKRKGAHDAVQGSRDYRELHKLHDSVQKKNPPATVSSIMHQKPLYSYIEGGKPDLSFLTQGMFADRPRSNLSSDYGDLGFDDFVSEDIHPEVSHAFSNIRNNSNVITHDGVVGSPFGPLTSDMRQDGYKENDEMLDDTMKETADSGHTKTSIDAPNNILQMFRESSYDYGSSVDRVEEPERDRDPTRDQGVDDQWRLLPTSSSVKIPTIPPVKGQSLFLNDTSPPQTTYPGFKLASSMLKDSELKELESVCISQEVDKMEAKTNATTEGEHVPEAYKDLEPWLFQEFGEIVEIVD